MKVTVSFHNMKTEFEKTGEEHLKGKNWCRKNRGGKKLSVEKNYGEKHRDRRDRGEKYPVGKRPRGEKDWGGKDWEEET